MNLQWTVDFVKPLQKWTLEQLMYLIPFLKRTHKKDKYIIYKISLRLEMILLRMFISSAGLTSMSYRTRSQKCDSTEAKQTWKHAELWGKNAGSWLNSTHVPSKLLEDFAELSLLLTLILFCKHSWPARWRLYFKINTTPFNKTWKQTEGAGFSGMQYTHRINLDKLGGVNVTKKKKRGKGQI